MDPGLTSTDLAWDQVLSSGPSPQGCVWDPSHHAKALMDSVKGGADSENPSGCDIAVKGLGGHEAVSCTPLLTEQKIMRFIDVAAAAA
jgi:hypothetical protein